MDQLNLNGDRTKVVLSTQTKDGVTLGSICLDWSKFLIPQDSPRWDSSRTECTPLKTFRSFVPPGSTNPFYESFLGLPLEYCTDDPGLFWRRYMSFSGVTPILSFDEYFSLAQWAVASLPPSMMKKAIAGNPRGEWRHMLLPATIFVIAPPGACKAVLNPTIASKEDFNELVHIRSLFSLLNTTNVNWKTLSPVLFFSVEEAETSCLHRLHNSLYCYSMIQFHHFLPHHVDYSLRLNYSLLTPTANLVSPWNKGSHSPLPKDTSKMDF